MKIETAVQVTKWASFVDHIKNNRIEYLLVLGIFHIIGITSKVYSHAEGVCM